MDSTLSKPTPTWWARWRIRWSGRWTPVDQSLITVVEGIESAGELSPSARMRDRLREVVRFESVVRLHALGNVVVINAQGDVILDSGSQEPRKANVADRDYSWRSRSGA